MYMDKNPNLDVNIAIRKEQFGFAENFNHGVKFANDAYEDIDYIVTINSDLLVPEFLFESIETAFNKYDVVGVVSNYAMGIQIVNADKFGFNDQETVLNMSKFNEACGRWRKENLHEYETTPVLTFLGVAIKKVVTDSIGLLDERYKVGTYEDVDFTSSAWKAGFKLGVMRECFAFHFGSRTFKAQGDETRLNEVTALNKLKFQEKYGLKTEQDIAAYIGDSTLNYVYGLYSQGFDDRTHDICEHLHTLKILADSVEHITEFGVRNGISTIAFLAGKPKVLRSYDIDDYKSYDTTKELIANFDIDYKFIKASTLEIDIEPTDLLFIDTLHTYDQLKAELERHAKNVKQYILFHDTYAYGYKGERENSKGLVPAIEEFLKANPNWKIKRIYNNCNGLLIIQNMSVE